MQKKFFLEDYLHQSYKDYKSVPIWDCDLVDIDSFWLSNIKGPRDIGI